MIVGVLILRKREPGADRPYRAWDHPYSTIVCLISPVSEGAEIHKGMIPCAQ